MNIIEIIVLTIASGLIGGFISYYFAEKTENYKFELLKKEQAAKLADLFAYWIKYDDETVKKIGDKSRKDYYQSLNKLAWELAIWIPDEKIISDIMNRLANKSQKNIQELILEARKLIQKKENKILKEENITYFK